MKNKIKIKKGNSMTEDKINSLTKQLKDKENLYLRALADYQNLEKRMQENLTTELHQTTGNILKQFLVIKNDIDKAEVFTQDTGLKLIKQKLESVLKNLGVQEISVLGQIFSPDTMECVQTKPDKKDNIVLEVNEPGYTYHGQLLKPAQVVVSKLKV